MHHRLRTLRSSFRPLALAASLATLASLAVAQTSSTPGPGRDATPAAGARSADGYSLLPFTRRGYAGINLGRSDYDTGCGLALTCDNPDLAGKVYTGGMFSDYLGAELGYINMGRADRGGGRTEAHGLNLSLMARLPIDRFNVFAKAGATYGRTRVSSLPGSGIVAGKDNGWGGSYGAGVGYDFTPTSGVVLEWERHDFRFAGSGRREVEMTSLGYVHRF